MSKPVYSLDLSPRENRHIAPSLSRDVLDIVGVGVLGLLLWVIAIVLFTTEGP